MFPIDPISWATSFLLTNAAKKGLEAVFSKTLRMKLTHEIYNWASETSQIADIVPEVLFSNVEVRKEDILNRPFLTNLNKKFLELRIPTKDDWYNSLIEQWRLIKNEQKQGAQDFFLIDENSAKNYLKDLANRLYNICIQEEKIALPHIVNKLDQISVTLDELKHINTIKSIPQNLELNSESYKMICNAARSLATKRGMPSSWELHFEKGGKTYIWLLFAESDDFNLKGVFKIDEIQVMSWTNLQDPILSFAISGAMFNMALFTDIEQNWNNIGTFIGQIAEFLYPNSKRDDWYGISSNYDLKRIGVPIPVGLKYDNDSDEMAFLKRGSHDLVPILTFKESELKKLIGLGEVEAGGQVAQWLFNKWGPPTILTNNR